MAKQTIECPSCYFENVVPDDLSVRFGAHRQPTIDCMGCGNTLEV